MAVAYENARSFFKALASMSEELRQALGPLDEIGRRRLLTQAIAESDMVFGVWPDEKEPEGFGVQVIKGEELMPPLVGFEQHSEIIVAAIPCVGLAQALAAREAWGPSLKEDAIEPLPQDRFHRGSSPSSASSSELVDNA